MYILILIPILIIALIVGISFGINNPKNVNFFQAGLNLPEILPSLRIEVQSPNDQ